ncbi:MAG: nitroreductase [Proteobacteria bacterium]|nr:nitroreductase [Pseudomonadota bacterium]
MTDATALEAWNVTATDFPRSRTTREQLAYLIRYAILAPSSHNTQPWQFHIGMDHIDLYADRSRSLAVIDPDHRQLIMSCGAALLNMRVAVRRFGFTGQVEVMPDPDRPEFLARIKLGLPVTPDKGDYELFDAIPQRHTNRQPFELRPVSYQIADQLSKAATNEQAWMIRLHPDAKQQAAELIAAADRVQFHDKEFRRELSQWLSPARSDRRDGIPVEAKPGRPIMNAPMVVRTFDMGNSVAATEHGLATGSPVLMVLGTELDEPLDWLRNGQAMQRVLLLGRTYGISASFLNQVLEIDRFRAEFAQLTRRAGYPQLVMRMGYGPPAMPTPRRPVEDVITWK